MNARDEWKAGLPRPVTFSARFEERENADAFDELAGPYMLRLGISEEGVRELTYEGGDEPLYVVNGILVVTRQDLAPLYAMWARRAREAGGHAYEKVVVLFDDVNVEEIDPRSREERRHGIRTHHGGGASSRHRGSR